MSEQRSNFAISHICPTQPPSFYAVQATQKCSRFTENLFQIPLTKVALSFSCYWNVLC